jgi:hypothetical protein
MRERPLTLIFFVLSLCRILEFRGCDTGRRNWRRRTGNASKHRDDDGEVSIELFLHLFDSGASEPSDMLDHFVVMFVDVGAESVVGHGRVE